ncbi:MAG: hypothetical protein AAFY34_07995 [Pseudomonadota bacterium]
MQKLPWWLHIIIILQIAPMFIGPLAALYANGVFQGTGAPEMSQFIYLARNFAVGFAFLVAYKLKNAAMLFILIFIRLLTDFVDLPTILYFGDVPSRVALIALFVGLYYVPSLFALRFLWRRIGRHRV